jgi:effector-binding domain-containing protein
MIDTPEIVQTEAAHTAIIRLNVPRSEIQNVMGPAVGEVFAAIAAQGLAPTGPLFSHHFRVDPAFFDFEIGVPVATPISASGRVQPGNLPAVRVARTNYRGPYEGLAGAWSEFGAWVTSQSLAVAGNVWESYAVGPETSPDPTQWRTELNKPLA